MKLIKLEQSGQIKDGDFLLIKKTNGVIFPAIAKEVIGWGENEEIIYAKGKNFYFITRMVLDKESGYISEVYIVPNAKATSVINNMNQHV